jgi:hypothetical protein
VLKIEGQARQTVLAGENLLLIRRITTRLGSSSLTVEDTVRNEGFRDTPHMLLYHCNFGFPVVSPWSDLLIHSETVRPRDAAAREGLPQHREFEGPDSWFAEQVFFHRPRTGLDGNIQVGIANRRLQFGAYIRYRADELPYLAQWKMMGAGDYVCALEPANQWETPRHKLREEGLLPYLAPGEEVHYRLELGALPDAEAISEFENSG